MELVKNPYSVLLDDEFRIIQKTRDIREKLVDNFIDKNGLPTRSGDMRVLNEIMNSMDSNVTSIATLNLKHEENKQAEDMTATIVDIFKRIKINSDSIDLDTKEIEVSDKFVPDDVVPGEDQIEYDELSMDEIMVKKG